MAKRFTGPTARWQFIIDSLPSVDQPRVTALKSVNDKFSRLIAERPAEMPKIDWSYYKARIAAPGMVDTFQKGFEGLKIPYPSDQGQLAATESTNAEYIKHAEATHKNLMAEISSLKKKLAELESLMKYSEMTVEEFYLAKPEIRLDPDNPKLWPAFPPSPETAVTEEKAS